MTGTLKTTPLRAIHFEWRSWSRKMLALLFAYVQYKPTLTVSDDCRRGAGVELEVLLEFQVVLLVDEIDGAVS